MFRRFCFSVVALALSSTIASAQVKLEPKYPEGAKSVVHRDTTSKQTLTLAGMDIDTKSSTFIVATASIGKRAADGTLKIEEKVETLQSEISTPGGLIQFDSANPDKKADNALLEPILDIFRTVYRNPVTVELDAKNKITAVKLPEGEYEKLSDAAKGQLNPEEMAGLKKWFSEFCNWLTTNPLGIKEGQAANNHSMAYDVQLTRYSLFTGDLTTARRVINEYTSKRLVPQIEADGKQPKELARVTSFHYSVANLGHMMDMCDMAKQLGVLLYSTGQKKGSIDMAFQYLIPYIDNESKFPYKDETRNWNSEARTLVNLIYRASAYNPEMAAKYLEIYRNFKGNDYHFNLTCLRP